MIDQRIFAKKRAGLQPSALTVVSQNKQNLPVKTANRENPRSASKAPVDRN